MEAEYVALSTSCCNLFPLIDVTREISKAYSIKLSDTAQMHVKFHEDNVGALALGKLEPHHMTPCSKHYAIKYHWFREHIGPRNIEFVKISSEDQLGNIFTKGLVEYYFHVCKRSSWVGESMVDLLRGSKVVNSSRPHVTRRLGVYRSDHLSLTFFPLLYQ